MIMTTKRCCYGLLLASLFGALWVTGCDLGDEEVEEEVSETKDEIINGSPIAAEESGVPMVGDRCSSTLVTNDWAISAAHCFSAAERNNPSLLSIVMGSQSTVGAGIWIHPTLDVGIVRLRTPFRMNGSTFGYLRSLYAGTGASLVNRTLDCRGYGFNTYGGGFGALRQAWLMVSSASATRFTTVRNSNGQIQWRGDSGSTCLDGTRMTGVASFCWHDNIGSVSACELVSPDAFRDWAVPIIFGFGPAYRAHDYFCVNGEECKVGDVNGDGRDDLITFIKSTVSGPAEGDVWVALSNGSGFGPPYEASDYFCIGNEECHVGDVNGDGRVDLIAFIKDTAAEPGRGDVWVSLSNGISYDPPYRGHEYFCVGNETCAVADFTGDRRADLITFIQDAQPEPGLGDVWVARSNGSTFEPHYRAHDYFCVGGEQCRTGDINGDGRADLITFIRDAQAESGRGDVWVTISDGNRFGPSYRAHEYFCVGNEECHVADVNGDSRSDLVIFIKDTKPDPMDPDNKDVWAAMSDGTIAGQGYKSHDYFCVGNEICVTGDINGDRRNDVITFIENTQAHPGFGDVWTDLSLSIR
jgi:hypothetical protein